MSESPSSLSPPQTRARASSTSRRPPLTLNTCSSRKCTSSGTTDPPSPDFPTNNIPPSESKETMTLPYLFSQYLQMLDFVRFTHPSPAPSMDETLLPTMAPSPTLSSFTDSLKEKGSPYNPRSTSVCIRFLVKVADRMANFSPVPLRHTFLCLLSSSFSLSQPSWLCSRWRLYRWPCLGRVRWRIWLRWAGTCIHIPKVEGGR